MYSYRFCPAQCGCPSSQVANCASLASEYNKVNLLAEIKIRNHNLSLLRQHPVNQPFFSICVYTTAALERVLRKYVVLLWFNTELNKDVQFFLESHKSCSEYCCRLVLTVIKSFISCSYIRRAVTLEVTVCCHTFERQESDCSLRHCIMLCFRELCLFLAPILLGVRGQCPAQCKCPSSQVANCASLALKNIPTDRYVQYTSLSQLKYRLMFGVCKEACELYRDFWQRVN